MRCFENLHQRKREEGNLESQWGLNQKRKRKGKKKETWEMEEVEET